MKILVFGNTLVKEDAYPIKIIPKLKELFPEFNFIEADPTEEIKDYGRNLKIIDCVLGIDSVKELVLKTEKDFEKLELGKNMSMHDFDLGFNLKLLRKTGLIDSVRVICVPVKIKNHNEIFNDIKKILEGWKNVYKV